MFDFKYNRFTAVLLKILVLISSQAEASDNWPMFRGSLARGISDNSHLPLEWDTRKNKNSEWKVVVPGLGWSNPVVHSGRIYLTSAVSDGEIEPRKRLDQFNKRLESNLLSLIKVK